METQQLEIISIDDHPVHGTFEVEVPQEYNDDQVRSYVGGLDLDLLLGVNDKESLGETNVEKIKEWENSTGSGKRDDKWFPHASLEGGTDTVAYGHKLTQEEADTGIIKVGDKEYNWREGLSDDAALAILDKDAGSAKNVALASLTKANMADDENKVQALTSLIYNVGSGAWGKSKAKKYLEAGNVEDFMHEAFSSEVGFVKINGDQSRGLVRRRAAEAQLVAQGNIDKGDSIMSQILDAINPISSAQAGTMADVIPQSQPTGQLGGVTVPEGKPTPPQQSEGALGNLQVPEKPTPPTVELKPVEISNVGNVKPPSKPEETPKFFKESIVPVYGDHANAALKHMGAAMMENLGLPVPDSFKEPITEQTLDSDVLNAVRVATWKAYQRGTATIYEDYGDAVKLIDRSKRSKLGTTGIVKEMGSSFFDPATAAGLTIGQSSGVVVENGRLKIKSDTYDFISIPKAKAKSDVWLNIQSWFSDKEGMFSVSPENQQKIEIDLGPVKDVEKYVNNLEDTQSKDKDLK